MAESQNFKELLLLLNDLKVEYLIVGGYAVMRYSEPRYTKDLDVWVGHSSVNSPKVFAALARFGAPLRHSGVTESTFSVPHTVYQIGVPPVRVDILTSITGCDFQDAWSRRVSGSMYGASVNFISLPDLIANKRAAGRAADVEHLKLLDHFD
jgi:predicted nucleotidyltransferase